MPFLVFIDALPRHLFLTMLASPPGFERASRFISASPATCVMVSVMRRVFVFHFYWLRSRASVGRRTLAQSCEAVAVFPVIVSATHATHKVKRKSPQAFIWVGRIRQAEDQKTPAGHTGGALLWNRAAKRYQFKPVVFVSGRRAKTKNRIRKT